MLLTNAMNSEENRYLCRIKIVVYEDRKALH